MPQRKKSNNLFSDRIGKITAGKLMLEKGDFAFVKGKVFGFEEKNTRDKVNEMKRRFKFLK